MIRSFALCVAALLVLPSALREVPPPPLPPTPATPLFTVHQGTISRHATLATLLAKTLSPPTLDRLVRAARPVYNLARLSVGHPFAVVLGPQNLLSAFTYGIDELRTLRVRREGETLSAEIVERHFDVTTRLVRGSVTSSLFAAVADAGEDDQLALDIADIFAWDVDFHTELRRGDSFRVAVESLSLDGKRVRSGRILAAELLRGSRVLRAVWFGESEGPGYYAPDGTPLRKAFLRSPLKYTRISSGFTTARLHPILGIVTTHLGIDYAAPTGTPVMASADGLVTLAGWWGGFGQAIKLRHPNGYETLYGHLSRIQVHAGQHVAQGEAIGAVGATGLATGPHLDYRMSRNGVFVNPLTVPLPPAEPVPSKDRPAFEAARNTRLALLENTAVAQRAD
jgi:murein DD-endopeptidase MepM/ murein hydrolase activator NlpD